MTFTSRIIFILRRQFYTKNHFCEKFPSELIPTVRIVVHIEVSLEFHMIPFVFSYPTSPFSPPELIFEFCEELYTKLFWKFIKKIFICLNTKMRKIIKFLR